MFDDLFTDDDFKIDDEEEEGLELETSEDEDEEVDHGPFCDHADTETCGPDCTCDPDGEEACSDCGGSPDPSADIGIDLGGDYCDDCGNDPCDCIIDEEEEDPTVWDTGYKKPPVPKNVWKPKHWKT